MNFVSCSKLNCTIIFAHDEVQYDELKQTRKRKLLKTLSGEII